MSPQEATSRVCVYIYIFFRAHSTAPSLSKTLPRYNTDSLPEVRTEKQVSLASSHGSLPSAPNDIYPRPSSLLLTSAQIMLNMVTPFLLPCFICGFWSALFYLSSDLLDTNLTFLPFSIPKRSFLKVSKRPNPALSCFLGYWHCITSSFYILLRWNVETFQLFVFKRQKQTRVITHDEIKKALGFIRKIHVITIHCRKFNLSVTFLETDIIKCIKL
jgi:hypothetical protein